MNCNYVRLAHYPHSEEMIRLANEMALVAAALEIHRKGKSITIEIRGKPAGRGHLQRVRRLVLGRQCGDAELPLRYPPEQAEPVPDAGQDSRLAWDNALGAGGFPLARKGLISDDSTKKQAFWTLRRYYEDRQRQYQ
jgi:hypothetical protein